MIEVQAGDFAFYDSPDVGHPSCYCSRCLQVIPEGVTAIRMWPPESDEEHPREWRYHPHCQGLNDDHYRGEPPEWQESEGDEWKLLCGYEREQSAE